MSKSNCNSCSCKKRISGAAINSAANTNMQGDGFGECHDVCVDPICGDPEYLTALVPVVYDEIGINICRSIEIPCDILSSYPNAVYASAEVLNVEFGCETTVTPISGRPNCTAVTLSNLCVTFSIRLFDCCKRLLTTFVLPNVTYLPCNRKDKSYDEDTNPSSVDFEIYTPYGLTYDCSNLDKAVINYIGFLTCNSTVTQGINMMALPKVLNFDVSDESITIGLTILLKTIYYSQYQLVHNGRAVVPKGSLITEEDSVCMDFVEGDLLEREIKPLELAPPKCEEHLKEDCSEEDECSNMVESDT